MSLNSFFGGCEFGLVEVWSEARKVFVVVGFGAAGTEFVYEGGEGGMADEVAAAGGFQDAADFFAGLACCELADTVRDGLGFSGVDDEVAEGMAGAASFLGFRLGCFGFFVGFDGRFQPVGLLDAGEKPVVGVVDGAEEFLADFFEGFVGVAGEGFVFLGVLGDAFEFVQDGGDDAFGVVAPFFAFFDDFYRGVTGFLQAGDVVLVEVLEVGRTRVEESAVVAFDEDGVLDVFHLELEEAGEFVAVGVDVDEGEVAVGEGEVAFEGLAVRPVAIFCPAEQEVVYFGEHSGYSSMRLRFWSTL